MAEAMNRARHKVVLAHTPEPSATLCQELRRAGFAIGAAVWDAGAAIEAVVADGASVCVLAPATPGDVLGAVEQITDASPGTAVVLVAAELTEHELFAALRAGAIGYLEPLPPARLARVLRGVLQGEAALSRKATAVLVGQLQARGSRRIALPTERTVELTGREWEILQLLRTGRSTAEIAERLAVSAVTVRSHVSSILRKFRVEDRHAVLRLLEVC